MHGTTTRYVPEFYRAEFASKVADMKNSVADRMNATSSCAGQFIANHLEVTCFTRFVVVAPFLFFLSYFKASFSSLLSHVHPSSILSPPLFVPLFPFVFSFDVLLPTQSFSCFAFVTTASYCHVLRSLLSLSFAGFFRGGRAVVPH